MPDIDFQKIELNLIPKKGEQPVVFYASQYETTRRFIADLFWGDTEYAPGVDCYAEIDIRKNDDNLVVITNDVSIDNNEVSVVLPVQAVTCIGKNLGQIKIYAGEDQFVAAFNFILEVQPDPLAGGVTSDTAIDNLESQIAAIVPEVIGEDYYDKTEVDALLADKADVSDLPDMSNYYNKTEADALLADKLNDYQLDDTPVLGSVSAAQIVSGWDSQHGSYKLIKNVALNTYSKSEIDTIIDNIFPTLTASGPIASFSTALNKPLVSVTADPGATTITRCGGNFTDISDKTMSGAGYVIGGFPVAINADNVVLPVGNYVFSFDIQNATYPCACQLIWYRNGVEVGNTVENISASGINLIAFTASGEFDSFVMFCNSSSGGAFTNFNLNIGSAPLTYAAYTSDTVPVADANTLVTLSGVNNVYADDGNVTVQYKYMSM